MQSLPKVRDVPEEAKNVTDVDFDFDRNKSIFFYFFVSLLMMTKIGREGEPKIWDVVDVVQIN